MRRIGAVAAAAMAALAVAPLGGGQNIAITTRQEESKRDPLRLLDGLFGNRFPSNPYRPHYSKHGPTVAQSKRAATKAKNRAKHRRACRGAR